MKSNNLFWLNEFEIKNFIIKKLFEIMKVFIILALISMTIIASSNAQEENNGTQVISKTSEKNENIVEKGVEGAKDVIEKGKEIGQTIIDSETERRQEIDQKRLETKEAVEQKGSEVIQNIEEATGGGCLIATATYGSELAPQVQQLREIRDNELLNTEVGTSFIKYFNQFYYSFSPAIADYERENPLFRESVKLTITPMISSLSILNYVDMGSELEVLGYGNGLILMNMGMYIAAPAVVIQEIKKRFETHAN